MRMTSFSSLFLRKAKSTFSVVGIITILTSIVPATAFAVNPDPVTVNGSTVEMITDNPDDIHVIYTFPGQVPADYRAGLVSSPTNSFPLHAVAPEIVDMQPSSQSWTSTDPATGYTTLDLDYDNSLGSCSNAYVLTTNFDQQRVFNISRDCGGGGGDEGDGNPLSCPVLAEGTSDDDVYFYFVPDGESCADGEKILLDAQWWDGWLINPEVYSATDPDVTVTGPSEGYPQLNEEGNVVILHFPVSIDEGDSNFYFYYEPSWNPSPVYAGDSPGGDDPGGGDEPGGDEFLNPACFDFDNENDCSSEENDPACEWQTPQGNPAFCAPMDPCKQYVDQGTCEGAAPGGMSCKWQQMPGTVGQFECLLDMKSNYPSMDGEAIDEIFTFPQPFNNSGNPWTDGDPYALDNRPFKMMQGVPKRWTSNNAPTIIGFPDDAPSTEQLENITDYVKIYKKDSDLWVDATSNFTFTFFPAPDDSLEDRIIVTTNSDLQAYATYRIAVSGLMKEAGEVDVLYGGQTNACPDESGDLCFTSTFSIGTSVAPEYGYQGAQGDSNGGCGPGIDFAVEWPFDGATGVNLDAVMKIMDCNGAMQEPNLQSGDVVLQQETEGDPVQVTTKGDFVDPAGNLIMKPEIPLNPFTGYALMQEETALSSFVTGNGFNQGSGAGGGGGMMTFGEGQLVISLVDNEGEAYTVSEGQSLPINVQCGNLPEMSPQGGMGMEPIEDMFGMDVKVNAGQSMVTLNGVPTPLDGEGFENPCIVTLRPDAQNVVMGDGYFYTGGVDSSPVDEEDHPIFGDYSVNDDFSMPMPPMHKYAEVWFGDDDGEEVEGNPHVAVLSMQVEDISPGTLQGVVCFNSYDGDGGLEECDDEDILMNDVEVSLFPLNPQQGNFGMNPLVVTDGDGEFIFPGTFVGEYMLEVRNRPSSGQNFNYSTAITVDGNTDLDVVVDPGLTLNVMLDNTSECWDMPDDPFMPALHFNFMPNSFGPSKSGVFGGKNMAEIIDNEDGTYTIPISGFKEDETYSVFIDTPGCKNIKDNVTFETEDTEFSGILDAGITIFGRVVTDVNNPDTTGVANMGFGAMMNTTMGPGGFGGFVGSGTDSEGNFEMAGLDTGTWQFQAFDGGFEGSQKSFLANTGSLGVNGTYLVTGNAEDLLLVVQQNKRVNISVNDGVNLVKDVMIDINCDSGKNVHLGHANNVWTFLPPSDTCRFFVHPKRGGFQSLENYEVAIDPGMSPQNITLAVNGFNKAFKSNGIDGSLKATKSTISPGQHVTYKGHLESTNGSPLSGTARITFPDIDGDVFTSLGGSGCTQTETEYSCPIPDESNVFNFAVEMVPDTDYEADFLNVSLYLDDVNIDNVFTDITNLTVNAPSYIPTGTPFTVFGEAAGGSSITLTANGIDGTIGTASMNPKSTWYSIPNVTIDEDGEYVLTVTSEIAGIMTTETKNVIVGDTATVDNVTVGSNGNNFISINSLTGLPSGQIFEGNPLNIAVTFTDSVENPVVSFLGTDYDMTQGEGDTWTLSIPAGWTGYGNASLDLTYDVDGESLNYGSIGEILILIDPSGYIYDTDTGNRIEGATVTLYQLVDAVTDAVITSIVGPDGRNGGDEDGAIEIIEEGEDSGDAVGWIDGCYTEEGTLDTALCLWSRWDSTSSGQENPQVTDEDGRYGWNVPQGWYRVAFQKDDEYSLSYSRDIYVPPAETELNVNLAAYDIAEPTVLSVVPADESISVPRNGHVYITFSEPMLQTSINSTNIELLEGASSVDMSIAYNTLNNTAKITPSSSLSPSTVYTLSISGVKDDSSNTMSGTLYYSFTTGVTADNDPPTSSADPAGDTYEETQTVTLSATDGGDACTNCLIYYTTDGEDPTDSSDVYTAPIEVSETTVLKYFAEDMGGNQEEAINTDTYTLDTSAPETPVNLEATGMDASVSLNWDDTDGATGYKVYRSLTSGGTYSEITTADTRPVQSLYTDLAVTNGTTYYYKVLAYNGIGDSSLSASDSATPAGAGDDDENDNSGGGASIIGGGGGSSQQKLETNTLDGLKIVKEAYPVTTGIIAENVTISTANSDVTVGLPNGVKITDADGKPFVGNITPPEIVHVNAPAPENKTILGNIYEIGIKDKGITFDKPVTLRFALPVVTKSTDKIAVYYLDESTNTWTIAGNGGKIMSDGKGGLVVVVEVTHFTKFSVMKSLNIVAKTFIDITSHWSKTYVEDIATRGIINGYSDNTYRPDSNMTRAELVKIAVNMFGLKVNNNITVNPFKDVPAGEWYGPYIKVALDNKIVKGYSDGSFRPNNYITRAEALKVLFETAKVTLPTTVNLTFSDIINSGWYAPYVEFAVVNGIASGVSKDKFEPARFITRGEAAKVSSLMIEKGLLSKTVSMLKDILGV